MLRLLGALADLLNFSNFAKENQQADQPEYRSSSSLEEKPQINKQQKKPTNLRKPYGSMLMICMTMNKYEVSRAKMHSKLRIIKEHFPQADPNVAQPRRNTQ